MYWTRAKWILIVLFFCINVFLLAYMLATTEEQVSVSKETVKDTVEILKSHQVNVAQELIPTKLSNMPILYLKQSEKKPDFSKWMGLGWQKQESEKEKAYRFGAKLLTVRDNGFMFEDKVPEGELDIHSPHAALDLVSKWLQSDNLTELYNGAKYAFSLPNERVAVVAHQRYGEKEIVGQELKVFVSRKGIEKMEGGLLVPYRVSADKIPLRHATGILISFVENKDRPEGSSTIQAIHLGYYAAQNVHTEGVIDTSAKPVWVIVTTEGEYVYDAMDGKYLVKLP